MKLHAPSNQISDNESPRSQLPEDDKKENSESTSQTARSMDNIAAWNTYLPEDCIRTMVAMGWDRST